MSKTPFICLALTFCLALAACGDPSGGGPKDSPTGMHFTCINASNNPGMSCDSFVTDAGDISNSITALVYVDKKNFGPDTVRMYRHGTVIYNGCAPQDISGLGSAYDVFGGQTIKGAGILNPYECCALGCSDYGPATYTETIYNASAYEVGETGDPDTDPVLDTVSINFNLVP